MIEKEKPGSFAEDFDTMIKIMMWNSLGFFFLDFLIPVFARDSLNASGTQVGLLISVLTLGILLSSPLAGYIVDKTESKKKLVFIGGVGRGTSYFVIFISIIVLSLPGLMVGMFILGFSAGFFWIPYNTLVAQKSRKENRAYAYGKKDLMSGIGLFVGGIIGFSMYGTSLAFSTENVFLVYGAIPIFGISNIISSFVFLRKVDESKRVDLELEGLDKVSGSNDESITIVSGKRKKRANLGKKHLTIGIVFLFSVVILSAINDTLVKPFLNIYVLENINDNELFAMAAYIPAGIASMIFAPRIGKLVDKIHPVVGVSITSILGAVITWVLINTTSIFGFSALLLIDVTIAKVAGLVVQNLVSRISRGNRGKMMGGHMVMQNLGLMIGPIFGGLAWDNLGQTIPFIISIFVELSLIPFYWAAVKNITGNMEEEVEK